MVYVWCYESCCISFSKRNISNYIFSVVVLALCNVSVVVLLIVDGVSGGATNWVSIVFWSMLSISMLHQLMSKRIFDTNWLA